MWLEETMKDEAYWHQKHPVVEQMYQGRPLPNGEPYDLDVRHFIWPDDIELRKILSDLNMLSGTPDDLAHAVQRYVCRSINYVSDTNIGSSEYWLYPAETLKMGQGDCEDGAILIASMLLNGLHESQHWRVRVSAGWVQSAPTAPEGGHGYCTYCRTTDNEWVVLDWCYYEDAGVAVPDKVLCKKNPKYKDVWFSFNHQFAWSHTRFDLRGRIKKR